MVLNELASYLHSQGIGTVASTLFKHALPPEGPIHETDPPQMALIERAGRGPVRSHDQPPARYEQPVVTVLARSSPYGYEAARALLQEAWEALDGLAHIELSGTRFLLIEALGSVGWIRDDELGRSLLSFDILCQRAL